MLEVLGLKVSGDFGFWAAGLGFRGVNGKAQAGI